MRNRKNKKMSLWANRHLWRIAVVTAACSLVYYLPNVVGLVSGELGTKIGVIHDFYGLDLYALAFFAPVLYAAYVIGVTGAVATALVSMLVLFPYSLLTATRPDAFFRPTAYAIILSAVGAVIAMLQTNEEQWRRNTNEFKCLFNIGKAVEESSSVAEFLTAMVKLIPPAIRYGGETRVKLTYRDQVFQSPAFETSNGKLKEDLMLGGEVLGSLEIYSTAGNAELKKRRALIRTLAERVGSAVHQIEMEKSLNEYYAQLEDMVEKRTADLKRAQEQLKLLSNTVKSSLDGITLMDSEGTLTFANESAQKMWGYTAAEMGQLNLSRLYSPGSAALITSEIIPGSRAGAWSGELVAIRKDGTEFPVFLTTSPVHNEEGKMAAIVSVHRDITETRNMRDKVIRSERLAAVGELASGVGHELRNPLNVIRNCLYLLNMMLDGKADEELLNTLKLADRQVDISNRIVSDLLDFTRVRLPSLGKVDLNQLVRESLSWIVVPENVTVVDRLDGDSLTVKVDSEQVGRAFANIITNAIQSISGKGELRLSTGTQDEHAWVKFEDTGCGITEENLHKLFEPLFTTKPKGIGLGLAITKRLVEQNGGLIKVASQVGKGTAFTIELPLQKGEVKTKHETTVEHSSSR